MKSLERESRKNMTPSTETGNARTGVLDFLRSKIVGVRGAVMAAMLSVTACSDAQQGSVKDGFVGADVIADTSSDVIVDAETVVDTLIAVSDVQEETREDVSEEMDTFMKEDTLVSDTEVVEDSAVADDTFIVEDTELVEDSAVIEDTYVAEDTTASDVEDVADSQSEDTVVEDTQSTDTTGVVDFCGDWEPGITPTLEVTRQGTTSPYTMSYDTFSNGLAVGEVKVRSYGEDALIDSFDLNINSSGTFAGEMTVYYRDAYNLSVFDLREVSGDAGTTVVSFSSLSTPVFVEDKDFPAGTGDFLSFYFDVEADNGVEFYFNLNLSSIAATGLCSGEDLALEGPVGPFRLKETTVYDAMPYVSLSSSLAGYGYPTEITHSPDQTVARFLVGTSGEGEVVMGDNDGTPDFVEGDGGFVLGIDAHGSADGFLHNVSLKDATGNVLDFVERAEIGDYGIAFVGFDFNSLEYGDQSQILVAGDNPTVWTVTMDTMGFDPSDELIFVRFRPSNDGNVRWAISGDPTVWSLSQSAEGQILE